ncbi:MAG: hypothetical protein JNM27_17845 [Leptospirales bacterium]|nr:hypothetical protein [Leptospirales bacterium]
MKPPLPLTLLTGLGLLLLPGVLLAYQPGKFTPLDVYVLKGAPAGPTSLVARAADGAILERAQFKYDGAGRLTTETFVNAKDAVSGTTEYKRAGDRLSEEVRKNQSGNIMSRTVYSYEGDNLSAIEVYNEQGVMELRRRYFLSQGKITSGEEIVATTKDKFIIKYDEGSTLPQALVFVQADGHPFGQILYRYDSQKRLTERERVQNERRELCKYEYDQKGRVQSYSYFDFIDNQWKLKKTLTYSYP